MKKIKPILLSTVLALGLTQPVLAEDPSADTVVAVVGEETITLGHMIALRQSLPQRFAQLPDDVLFPEILEQLVQQAALAQSVETLSNTTRLQMENERRALIASDWVEAQSREEVPETDIQAAYDAAYANAAAGTEYNASHILVETEAQARDVIAEIAGGADFAAVAQAKSTGPSSVNGGNLGWFGAGMMVPSFEAAVVAMEPGAISEPVQTQFGWHVIQLNEQRTASAPGLEEVRGDLTAQVRQDMLRAAIGEVVAATQIERPDISGIDPSVLSNPSLIE